MRPLGQIKPFTPTAVRYNPSMNVYVEYVIADNFTLTYLIAALSYRICLKRVRKLRACVCAIVGTVVAVFYPFISSNALLTAIKFALWAVLTLILFAKTPKPIAGGGVFMAVTLLFGGALFALSVTLTGDVDTALRTSVSSVPLSAIIVCGWLVYLIAKRVAVSFNRTRIVNGYSYRFSVTVGEKSKKLIGFMDSGNVLFDNASGLPVIVLSLSAAKELIDENALVRTRTLKVQTLTNSGKIMLVRPDKFVLYLSEDKNIFSDVMLGVSGESDFSGTDALLSPALIK